MSIDDIIDEQANKDVEALHLDFPDGVENTPTYKQIVDSTKERYKSFYTKIINALAGSEEDVKEFLVARFKYRLKIEGRNEEHWGQDILEFTEMIDDSEVANMLNYAAQAVAKEMHGEWISPKYELPKLDTWVRVRYRDTHRDEILETTLMYTTSLKNEKFWYCPIIDNEFKTFVLSWQPSPLTKTSEDV